MRAAAQTMGKEVRTEDGQMNAINFIDQMATSFDYPWPTK
jgi:hypothetical protein